MHLTPQASKQNGETYSPRRLCTIFHLQLRSKTDVVGIVAHAWEKNFAKLRTNKQKNRRARLGTLIYSCLLNPQLTNFGVVPLNRISHSNRSYITAT
jgi:hypothetical protein